MVEEEFSFFIFLNLLNVRCNVIIDVEKNQFSVSTEKRISNFEEIGRDDKSKRESGTKLYTLKNR